MDTTYGSANPAKPNIPTCDQSNHNKYLQQFICLNQGCTAQTRVGCFHCMQQQHKQHFFDKINVKEFSEQYSDYFSLANRILDDEYEGVASGEIIARKQELTPKLYNIVQEFVESYVTELCKHSTTGGGKKTMKTINPHQFITSYYQFQQLQFDLSNTSQQQVSDTIVKSFLLARQQFGKGGGSGQLSSNSSASASPSSSRQQIEIWVENTVGIFSNFFQVLAKDTELNSLQPGGNSQDVQEKFLVKLNSKDQIIIQLQDKIRNLETALKSKTFDSKQSQETLDTLLKQIDEKDNQIQVYINQISQLKSQQQDCTIAQDNQINLLKIAVLQQQQDIQKLAIAAKVIVDENQKLQNTCIALQNKYENEKMLQNVGFLLTTGRPKPPPDVECKQQ